MWEVSSTSERKKVNERKGEKSAGELPRSFRRTCLRFWNRRRMTNMLPTPHSSETTTTKSHLKVNLCIRFLSHQLCRPWRCVLHAARSSIPIPSHIQCPFPLAALPPVVYSKRQIFGCLHSKGYIAAVESLGWCSCSNTNNNNNVHL